VSCRPNPNTLRPWYGDRKTKLLSYELLHGVELDRCQTLARTSDDRR
jgi:hypothetical protein